MARITKDVSARRDELLDVTLDLCVSVGFEGMSVEQVTTAAGVAKGTFYHYFASKQDLLLHLVERFGEELFTYLETEMVHVEGDALQRLRGLMALSARWKIARLDTAMEYVPFLFKEENYTLRHRLYSAWLSRTRPMLLSLVEQGVAEKTFDVTDAGATTDVLLSIWYDAANRLWEKALPAPDDETYADILYRGVSAMWTAQERILGVPEGSLRVEIDRATLASMRALIVGHGGCAANGHVEDDGGRP